MRRLLAGLVLLAACARPTVPNGAHSSVGGNGAPDLSSATPDDAAMDAAPDLAPAARDMTQPPPDASVPPDMAQANDLATPPDLATLPDLATACAHSICSTGAKLVASCDACATKICAQDPYCCNTSWNSICVGEVGSICMQTCH